MSAVRRSTDRRYSGIKMEKISEIRLERVNPKLANAVRMLSNQLVLLNIEIRVVQGLRSWAEQQALYDQGRTTQGAIVTKCVPGMSWHNFGLAVDVAPDLNAPGKPYVPDWNPNHLTWKTMEANARSLGFVCGADFRTFPDNPHLQITGRFPVNPDDEVRQLFKDGGVQAVWDEAGL
jgi:peptidoglycan L-alanyl-D-glutamate endopeptidase CwlK